MGAADLFGDEMFDELVASWKQLNPTFKNPRPWAEFFEVFKPPVKTDVERRMSTNLLHYKPNYCLIFSGVMALGLLASPWSAWLAYAAAAGVAAAAVNAKPEQPYAKVGDRRVALSGRNRALAAVGGGVAVLALFGALLWVLVTFSVALLLPLAHMALRPRSFAAKYNVATDEVRGLFGGTSAVDDAQNAEGGTALHSRGARRRAASRETSPKNGPTRAPPGFTEMGAP